MSVVFAQGFSTSSCAAGVSAIAGKKDLALIVNNGPLDVAAGVFTANRFAAAPVQYSRQAISDGHAKAVVINTGSANACTGEEGYKQSQATAAHMAELMSIKGSDVLIGSTGVIGELLSMDKIFAGIDAAFPHLSNDPNAGLTSAEAIMTTDTKPKVAHIDGDGYKIGGMVKGSGMIAPQLATMICVITTDAVITAEQADSALRAATAASFDRIDVDGCMSTNDTVLLLASGASGVTPDFEEFSRNIKDICSQFSRMIIGDGEGSSHDIRVNISGATSEAAALACGRAVANSNLLKCAISGEDPNWGRVVSSLGVVPVEIAPYDPNLVTVDINRVRVCDGGKPDQPRSQVSMMQREVDIDINLNTGSDYEATVWTNDLTHEYVHINADYKS